VPKPRGRHSAMGVECEGGIFNWIENWEKSNPVTRTDIRCHCETQFAIPITRCWVDSFISRHQTGLMETRSRPEEEPRLQVPRVFMEETVPVMREAVHDYPSTRFPALMKSGCRNGKIEKWKRWWFP
jgi:hypothetical protein